MKGDVSPTYFPRVSSICWLAVCTAWLAAPSFAQDGDPDLREVVEQFQSVSSLHFTASVDLRVFSADLVGCCVGIAADGTVISGKMEYWAAGDMYRLNSYMDPAKYPGMDSEFAYDGQHFQLLLKSGSVLTYSAQDNASVVIMLPNPLLELLQFRYPFTEANAGLRLRLKDVISDQIPEEFWNVNCVNVEENGQVLERAEFPGGTYQGQQYVHHVFTLPGSRNKPLRIDWVTTEATISSAEFSHYFRVATTSGPTFWPRSVILRAFDSQGKRAAEMSFVITDFSVNAAIPQEIFTISTVGVQTVWDDDLQMFVQ